VKPYVKRHKNDATDAEAICEAVARPNMRFVATKTPEQQSCLTLHRTRHLFIRPVPFPVEVTVNGVRVTVTLMLKSGTAVIVDETKTTTEPKLPNSETSRR
jgi:hypothetical protein